MDKKAEFDRRGAALKAELIAYRKWFGTPAVSPDLKRAAVAFFDEGVAFGMWPRHAARLIGSTPATVARWREAVAHADIEMADLGAGDEPAAGIEVNMARLFEAERARDAAQAELAASKRALAGRDAQIEALEDALFVTRQRLDRVRWLHTHRDDHPGLDGAERFIGQEPAASARRGSTAQDAS